ncbi:MAG: 4-alpha-glucanotransferase, partial [Lachnospiraceae bacterium]|nr:4-alpha-glucanotransferase [Lachnospiraceae bacterium]
AEGAPAGSGSEPCTDGKAEKDPVERPSFRHFTPEEIAKLVTCAALSLPPETAVIPVQDLLGLAGYARINAPGVVDDVNWTWKLAEDAPFRKRIPEIRKMFEAFGRV